MGVTTPFILFLFVSASYCALRVLSGPLIGTTIPSSEWINETPFVSAHNFSLVRYKSGLNGDAVLLEHSELTSGVIIEASKQYKAVIIEWSTTYMSPGCSMYFFYERASRHLNVPVVEISRDDINVLYSNDTLEIEITPGGNKCNEYFTSVWHVIFQTVLMALCVSVIALCFYRLYQYYSKNYCGMSLGIVAISIELFASALKFISIINFFGSHRLYHYQADDFLLTFSTPFTTITNVMVTMFWHEALVHKGLAVHKFLHTTLFRVLFFMLFVILVAFEVMASIARLASNDTPTIVVLIPHVLNFVTNLATLIYSTFILYQVYKKLSIAAKDTSKSVLRKIRFRMTANSVLLLLLLICIIVLAIPPPKKTAVIATTLITGVFYALQISLSILQVYSFQPPTKPNKGSTNSTEITIKSVVSEVVTTEA